MNLLTLLVRLTTENKNCWEKALSIFFLLLGVYSDGLSHGGGYGTVDDYAPYPHLLPSASPDYSHPRSNNPSRQDYSPDKPLRQHHIGKQYFFL